MTTVSRRKTAPLLWVLRPARLRGHGRHKTELSFQRGAQAYLWRTNRDFLKTGKN